MWEKRRKKRDKTQRRKRIKQQRKSQDQLKVLFVGWGFLVDFAEKPEEIDERRAREALERAQEAMRQKQSIQEYHMSQANIARAMARLAAKRQYTNINNK